MQDLGEAQPWQGELMWGRMGRLSGSDQAIPSGWWWLNKKSAGLGWDMIRCRWHPRYDGQLIPKGMRDRWDAGNKDNIIYSSFAFLLPHGCVCFCITLPRPEPHSPDSLEHV